jgi:hypothetical protein
MTGHKMYDDGPRDDEQNANGSLTLAERAQLASLALTSEVCADLAERLREPSAALSRYAARRTDLGTAAQLLQKKAELLRELSAELGRMVMQYSLLVEDARAPCRQRLAVHSAARRA